MMLVPGGGVKVCALRREKRVAPQFTGQLCHVILRVTCAKVKVEAWQTIERGGVPAVKSDYYESSQITSSK